MQIKGQKGDASFVKACLDPQDMADRQEYISKNNSARREEERPPRRFAPPLVEGNKCKDKTHTAFGGLSARSVVLIPRSEGQGVQVLVLGFSF